MKKSVYVSPALCWAMRAHKLNWSDIAQKAWLAAIAAEKKKARDHAELVSMLGPYIPPGTKIK